MLRVIPSLLLAACLLPVEAQVCEKFDECNVLSGESVSECTDAWSSMLDDLSESERHDCESDLAECVGKHACADFLQCEIRCTPGGGGGGGDRSTGGGGSDRASTGTYR